MLTFLNRNTCTLHQNKIHMHKLLLK